MATDFFGRVTRDDLPNPAESPELFEGILTRRVLAFFIDCVIMGILVTAVVLVAGILGLVTLGLAWLAIPVAVPVVFIAYYAVTLGSPSRATLGMRATDIVLTPTRGTTLDGHGSRAVVLAQHRDSDPLHRGGRADHQPPPIAA